MFYDNLSLWEFIDSSKTDLGNLYSEHLRDTITACIQTDRMARPDITQIRLKCEQMLQVFDKWNKNTIGARYFVISDDFVFLRFLAVGALNLSSFRNIKARFLKPNCRTQTSDPL